MNYFDQHFYVETTHLSLLKLEAHRSPPPQLMNDPSCNSLNNVDDDDFSVDYIKIDTVSKRHNLTPFV